MRITLLAIAATFAFAAGPARADLHITRDHGGYVDEYKARYKRIRDKGERVIIDGICNSACTLVFGIVPMNKICRTRRPCLRLRIPSQAWMLALDINGTSTERRQE